MKILIVGNGGREHALGFKIKQSAKVEKLYFAPGNGGTKGLGENVAIQADDIENLVNFAKKEEIDLTVVGPEVPLSLGIADEFLKAGLAVFAPNQKAAMLESSKIFAKNFMNKHHIPTAKFNIYTAYETAVKELETYQLPVVIKADGLASGKGVLICNTLEEANHALEDMMKNKKFGLAGDRIIIEEFLEGTEASILCFVDGKTIKPMVSAKDYKRALDHDGGLNTGGMGAVSPAPDYDEAVRKIAEEDIINRTLKALNEEDIDFKGVLYFGLMLTAEGPKLLEYNTRFGDPETEAILMKLDTDLVSIMMAVCEEKLDQIDILWKDCFSMCVVMASGGYPEQFEQGFEITGLPVNNQELAAFHGGTAESDGKVLTSGGRVLIVSAAGENKDNVRSKIYETVKQIKFEKAFYRNDIGSGENNGTNI